MKFATVLLPATCFVLSAVLAPVFAQQGVTRTSLGTTDFPPGYQTVADVAQVAPGLCSERHTHPGIESGYVVEGDLLLKIDGKPDQHLKSGDPVQIPAGIPHTGCTTGGVKLFTIHVVEKDKPFATSAP